MNRQTSLDRWPLIDPNRDLIGLPEMPGLVRSEARRVFRAHPWVVEQMVAEKILTKQMANTIISPGFSALHDSIEQQIRRQIMVAFSCLEHIARIYVHDQELQEYLDLPSIVQQWVLPDLPDSLRRIDLCRLDLLGENLGALRILEFNANNPAGLIRSGTLARLWRQVPNIADLLDEWKVATAPFEQQDWFIQRLLALGASHGLVGFETRKIGLFYDPENPYSELTSMEKQVLRAGSVPILLNPMSTVVPEDVHLGYLMYNPRTILLNTNHWDAFCARVSSGQLVIPNPFAGRLVTENKLCLAVMSEPRFRRLFTVPQRQALDALIPWSRKLGDGITTAEAITNQRNLVLKAPYGSRGELVYLGRQHSREDWAALLCDPSRYGWLIQQYLHAPQIDTAHGPYYRDFCVWIVNGKIAGYTSRISQRRRLNLAQGGAIQVVFGRHLSLDYSLEPPKIVGH